MTDLEKVVAAIEEQQKKVDRYSPVRAVGNQLKDIIFTSEDIHHTAKVVLQDFENAGMSIADCEKKISAFAQKNRKGNFGFCPPEEADRIIREFYGIPARVVIGVDLANGPDFTAEVKPAPKPKKFNLANYL